MDDKKLDFYIEHGLNVLFRGRHGVGKTAMVKDAFERNGLKWRYFSAATMDPWVDFVGIPKEKHNPETGETYIGLVRPEGFHNDDVEAIFMDELNRSKDKVRNAVMELIQFKSINGVKFNNLKMIWAAVNPEDEEEADLKYDVEVLDPAQKDRFQIIMDIPYEPSMEYFIERFGDRGHGAVEWWKQLSPEQNMLVSPRRLEYAVQLYTVGGDLRDVLPNHQLNVDQLRQRLNTGSIEKKLETLFEENDENKTKKQFSNINFATDAVNTIIEKDEYIQAFAHYLPKDIISKLVSDEEGKDAKRMIMNTEPSVITDVLIDLLNTEGIKGTVMQKITINANERGLDLTSEQAMKQACTEGLEDISSTSEARYESLHAVNQNYNHKASLETYELCLEFMAKMIYYTPDKTLKTPTKPFKQLGRHIIQKLDYSLTTLHNTDVLTEWNRIKDRMFSDEKRNKRIGEYLEWFLGK